MEEAKRSWVEKTEKLNYDKDGKKLWKLTKALNYEKSSYGEIVLQKDEQTYTGKQAADLFIDEYAEISDLEIPIERDQEVNQELQEYQNLDNANEPTEMNCPFNNEELKTALSTLQLQKAPGPDEITNEMLINMGPQAKKKMLQLINDSWRSGILPKYGRKLQFSLFIRKEKTREKLQAIAL